VIFKPFDPLAGVGLKIDEPKQCPARRGIFPMNIFLDVVFTFFSHTFPFLLFRKEKVVCEKEGKITTSSQHYDRAIRTNVRLRQV